MTAPRVLAGGREHRGRYNLTAEATLSPLRRSAGNNHPSPWAPKGAPALVPQTGPRWYLSQDEDCTQQITAGADRVEQAKHQDWLTPGRNQPTQRECGHSDGDERAQSSEEPTFTGEFAGVVHVGDEGTGPHAQHKVGRGK